ncbi:uncharacterized protein LOC115254828 [Aedes albopictus]|uniref:CCHC-type domain-containing protein n=1 Tax=Aedes albopictus TaxID=7160 RepID=A0ABM1ZAG7_AEDAL
MASKRHDNGAVDAPVRKMKKKNPKMDTIVKELAEEKSARVELSKQLEKANETIKALQMSLRSPRSESVDSAAFSQQAGPSSTQRRRNEAEAERSRFLTSVNQMSLSSINVPECKPSVAGEQIGRRDYESWIDLLTDSLKLAGVEDEPTKFVVFKVKAGPMLLDVFKNTKSTPESPKEEEFPYANALSRLKLYFGSASDIMLQRRKLALMVQGTEESDLSFIMRVNSIARLCDYKEGKEFEEIVSTVATHARDKDVRIVALKMLNRQDSFTELVDAVREIEAVKMNEEYYRMQHEKQEKKAVAAVSAAFPKAESYRPTFNRRSVPRGRFGHPYAGHSRFDSQRSSNREGERSTHKEEAYRCFRCDSVYHKAEACYAIDKTCLKCGRRGHIQRACRSIKTEQSRRPGEEDRSVKPEKVASIEVDVVAKAEEHADEQNVGVDIPK